MKNFIKINVIHLRGVKVGYYLLLDWHMGIRKILGIGHPALRRCATEVPDNWYGSERLKRLIEVLFDTKLACFGAGLAATQIDEPWRVFVVGMGHSPRYPDAQPC